MNYKTASAGKLFGIGCGPGDPELLTVKAVNCLSQASVIAYPAHPDGTSRVLEVVRAYVTGPSAGERTLLPLMWPMTRRNRSSKQDYSAALSNFYDASAQQVAAHLDSGDNVAFICVGDPVLYGSFMHLFERLSGRYQTEIIPGVTSPQAAAASGAVSLCKYTEAYQILPATMGEELLRRRLGSGGASAIIKLGSNLDTIKGILSEYGLLEGAVYAENVTCEGERIMPLVEVTGDYAPYFSLILVPAAAHGKKVLSSEG